MKKRTVHILQGFVIVFTIGFLYGILFAGMSHLISMKLSLGTLLMSAIIAIIALQLIRPVRYRYLRRAKRQRDKAIQQAEEAKSKRVVVQQNINNIFYGDNHGAINNDKVFNPQNMSVETITTEQVNDIHHNENVELNKDGSKR